MIFDTSHRIFDIETVPDNDVWTPGPPKFKHAVDDKGVPVLLQEVPFPPPQAHRVVAISWVDLISEDEGKQWFFYKASQSYCEWSYSNPDRSERDLLKLFIDAEQKDKATLVTWNGRTFDLPVISLRAMKHGLPMPFYYSDRDMRYRYSEAGHCDLMDFLSDYGAVRYLGLGDAAKLIGLPGKVGDVSGSNITEIYAKDDHDQSLFDSVAKYCLSDTIQTAILYIRSRLHKGLLNVHEYNRAIKSFFKPEVQEALDGYDLEKVLVKE